MPDLIERNLLILLDPAGEVGESEWRFVPWQDRRGSSASSGAEDGKAARTVYCFARGDFIDYILFRWHAKKQGVTGRGRKILYMNDGLLSSVFDAGSEAAYRAFAADHLPRPKTPRQRLVSLLPVSLRAEMRYVAIDNQPAVANERGCQAHGVSEGLDFMFFSNAAGKILLTRAETIRTGKGTVFKTTTNAGYAKVMEREYSTMNGIAGLQGNAPVIPATGNRLQIGERTFFTEQYVKGKTLREVLHTISRRNDVASVYRYIDRLDEWFQTYVSLSRGDHKPLSSCYGHLFDAFNSLYGSDRQSSRIAACALAALDEVSRGHGGVTTVFAHNDLWPGNFIVNEERVFAIDWERATPGRAPFFDYYWMIISAVLEYHVSRLGVIDYSKAMRIFLEDTDAVSNYASSKLASYLERHALDGDHHQSFLLLFLMEWSVQGYLALGSQTDMDRLAFGELLHFAGETASR